MTGSGRPGGLDVFVSYAGPQRPWAEWVADQLRKAGLTVELDVWDWATGSNAVLNMNTALARADRVVALYSAAYFEPSRFTTDEWTAVIAERPGADGRRRLVPLRVEPVQPPPILAPLVYRDLFDLGEEPARQALLSAVFGSRSPDRDVSFPGATAVDGVRLPGSRPGPFNVPRRLMGFTGRTALLARLREQLTAGGRTVVQALYGIGGVGKTQLAIEYAHLFAGDYELVWWIDSEKPELIGEQIAALAVEAGWAEPGTADAKGVRAVQAKLRHTSRWLLVFDNAESAEDLEPWLPPQTGHTVITSRNAAFLGVAVPVGIDVFTRAESVDMVRQNLPTLPEHEADRLAAALGDLPLALAQAVGFMDETRMPVTEYLVELSGHAHDVLGQNRPLGYPAPLAAAIEISASRLAEEDPAALALLHLCAHLAPDPVPLAWFTPTTVDDPLATVVAAPRAFRHTLSRLARLGLLRLAETTIQMHRLTQAVLRELSTPEHNTATRRQAEDLVANQTDVDGTDPSTWPRWAEILPHVLALNPADGTQSLQHVVNSTLWYLISRGEYRIALPLAETQHQRLLADLGPDDADTLLAIANLSAVLTGLGEHERARELDEDTLARRRRILGDDHPDTLNSAHYLAVDLAELGEHERARELDEDTLARRRRILGDDHPRTLRSANNLAANLAELGEHERARELDEDTLARRRRILGDDHPDTLSSAHNLAANLATLGEYERARELNEDTLARHRRILGDDHPDTLSSAHNLAANLATLGEYERARELDEDTLARRRRILGDDHPDTLNSAHNLAANLSELGEHERARELDEDTLARRRRILGDDHPDTLNSAHNLAANLSELGEHERARELDEDTLARRRRILGDDHPDTLNSAHYLAVDLSELGEHERARELDEDTLARRRRILGDDHPRTLRSANNLAANLAELGEHERARQLGKDTLGP
ncbi:FxSxx-COOH system tetratricopeptide repeat protein [Phytohabitans rumicis]|uniref:ATP-binding protein n=1 Tax=Phytohabitans rumicis TaxID=1076125 RepID=A0A6V8L178_9ACTN|nr:FxSxx-COOH system tetratricopeptide repeat protein [Phytohabitans rumicis]GFJ91042.1 ATP-binding protein [Phytohabitans rumicis]